MKLNCIQLYQNHSFAKAFLVCKTVKSDFRIDYLQIYGSRNTVGVTQGQGKGGG